MKMPLKYALGFAGIMLAFVGVDTLGKHINEDSKFQVLGMFILAFSCFGALLGWLWCVLTTCVKWLLQDYNDTGRD